MHEGSCRRLLGSSSSLSGGLAIQRWGKGRGKGKNVGEKKLIFLGSRNIQP